VAEGAAVGALLAVRLAQPCSFDADDLRLLTVLANQTTVVLENRRLYEQLKQEAVTDGLTGIYNYRSLMRALRHEVQRSARHGNQFVFVMADVDHLKNYNERFGHIAGSQVLAEIASLLLGNCRSTDIVGKYGGDEFGMVLPQTGTPGARALVERMRQAIAAHTFQHLQPGEITCSFGVAAYPQDGQQARDLVRVADAVLFRAKRAGKNTVLTALDVPCDEAPQQQTADAP
jgi:diguanylate cyclase (GGDEF)-like protein